MELFSDRCICLVDVRWPDRRRCASTDDEETRHSASSGCCQPPCAIPTTWASRLLDFHLSNIGNPIVASARLCLYHRQSHYCVLARGTPRPLPRSQCGCSLASRVGNLPSPRAGSWSCCW